MNTSAVDVGLIPPSVVTVTFTVPGYPGGEVAVHVVVLEQFTPVARFGPKFTVVVLGEPVPVTKPVPVIVTGVPPAAGPLLGMTAVTVGGP